MANENRQAVFDKLNSLGIKYEVAEHEAVFTIEDIDKAGTFDRGLGCKNLFLREDVYKRQDIHRLTASQVFNVPFEEVTPLQRSNAKAVNFGIVYGIGAFSLSQDIGVSRKEAERYIEGYFEKYPKVKEFMDNSVEKAHKLGYASTIFNRIRYIPEISSSNYVQRSFGERVAMNMPVQGSAADIIKIAMVKVYQRLKAENLKSKLILQVHDELLIETEKSELEIVKKILTEEMENAVSLSVPLETDVQDVYKRQYLFCSILTLRKLTLCISPII